MKKLSWMKKEIIQLNKNFEIQFRNFFQHLLSIMKIKNSCIQLIRYQLILLNSNHTVKRISEISN